MVTRGIAITLLTALLLGSAAPQECSKHLPTTDLVAEYNFQPFGMPRHAHGTEDRWKRQQGLAFISKDTLAVYQVMENTDLPALSPRDPSGGGGKFQLKVVFLSTGESTKPVHDFTFVTDGSGFSGVIPTHDGRFIVRAGNFLRLFSSSFQPIAASSLPRVHQSADDSWMLAPSASGKILYAEHSIEANYDGLVERCVIDADTLHPTTSAEPETPAGWPLQDIYGPWRRLVPESVLNKKEEFHSVVGNQNYVAAEIEREGSDPFDMGPNSKPQRIVVYDLAHQAQVCAQPISEPVSGWFWMRLYAVSPDGTLAVIQNSRLSICRK